METEQATDSGESLPASDQVGSPPPYDESELAGADRGFSSGNGNVRGTPPLSLRGSEKVESGLVNGEIESGLVNEPLETQITIAPALSLPTGGKTHLMTYAPSASAHVPLEAPPEYAPLGEPPAYPEREAVACL